MNIILKSFDGSLFEKAQIEHALKGMDIGTCITISNLQEWTPDIPAREHIWVNAGKQRVGDYTGVDWNDFAPLDADLIEGMRECETFTLKMVGRYALLMPRYAITGDVPFNERRRQYLAHLRYWNHILQEKKIDIVVMNQEPHQSYDEVLYELCRFKGIPVWYLNRTYTVATSFMTSDWKDPCPELRETYEKLREKYADETVEIELSPNFEHFFRFNRDPRPVLKYAPRFDIAERKPFFSKWFKKALKVLRKNPKRFVASVLSREFWARKLGEDKAIHLYDQLAKTPDLSKPYVYLALQMQPEASTLPLGGVFEDQELMVQMVAAYLPKGWHIYIKENPQQGERWRSEKFYRTLLSIPSVTLVPKETNTFMLMDSAKAVATVTGTPAFEASLRGKPTLLFGYVLWQYAPGVFPIRKVDDCRKAFEKIVAGEALPSERQARIFVKAMETLGVPYPGSPRSPVDTVTEEEKARLVGAMFRRYIERSVS